MPAWLVGADVTTAAGSGATVKVRPAPNTRTPGSTSDQPDPGPTPSSRRRPAAATTGPAVMKGRGPSRAAAAPTRAEPTSMSAVMGSSAAPDASGPKPAT